MAALKAVLAAIALVAAAPAAADSLDRWSSQIAEASARFAIPASWIRRVMRAESGGRTILGGRAVVSSAGAMGLMQLMPPTWAEMRALLGLGPDPFDPHDNILAGAFYLRLMFDRFGYPGLFAAYNAGPARYAASLSGQRPLPPETRRYLVNVAGRSPASVGPPPIRPRLFVLSAANPPAFGLGAAGPATARRDLFIPLGGGAGH